MANRVPVGSASTNTTGSCSHPWLSAKGVPVVQKRRKSRSIFKRIGHTCQPSQSRRDSPDLETETRRPAQRPKKTDLSRSTPKNTILNLPFACSLCSSVGIQVSSVSFDLFSCTRPWWADIQTKNLYIRALFWFKSSFFCHFSVNARNFVYIFI